METTMPLSTIFWIAGTVLLTAADIARRLKK
jgi:hypothetical protein